MAQPRLELLARHAAVLSVEVVMLCSHVIAGEVENRAAGEAATWTGRPQTERTGRERIKSRSVAIGCFMGFLDYASLRSE
jgi:hypothetical protein